MKVLRSSTPRIYDASTGAKAIIAVRLKSLTWDDDVKRYFATINDYTVDDVAAPDPGTSLKIYRIINTRVKDYDCATIDNLFSNIGISISPVDSYSEKMDVILFEALKAITRQFPAYNFDVDTMEEIDTEVDEIVPLDIEVAPLEEPTE